MAFRVAGSGATGTDSRFGESSTGPSSQPVAFRRDPVAFGGGSPERAPRQIKASRTYPVALGRLLQVQNQLLFQLAPRPNATSTAGRDWGRFPLVQRLRSLKGLVGE